MRCPRCDEQNEDSDRFCSACGQNLTGHTPPPVPPDPSPGIPSYLGWAAAILTCCWPAWPAGVTAVVLASRTESRLEAGDLAGAREYSRKAKTWCWITLVAGLVLWAVSLTLVLSFC